MDSPPPIPKQPYPKGCEATLNPSCSSPCLIHVVSGQPAGGPRHQSGWRDDRIRPSAHRAGHPVTIRGPLGDFAAVTAQLHRAAHDHDHGAAAKVRTHVRYRPRNVLFCRDEVRPGPQSAPVEFGCLEHQERGAQLLRPGESSWTPAMPTRLHQCLMLVERDQLAGSNRARSRLIVGRRAGWRLTASPTATTDRGDLRVCPVTANSRSRRSAGTGGED